MKYAVFGPRHDSNKRVYDDVALIAERLSQLRDVDGIVSGGGHGIERLAEQWAKERGIASITIAPDIKAHGRVHVNDAFDVRNKLIVQEVDAVVIFWNDWNGLMIKILTTAASLGKKFIIVFPLNSEGT